MQYDTSLDKLMYFTYYKRILFLETKCVYYAYFINGRSVRSNHDRMELNDCSNLGIS